MEDWIFCVFLPEGSEPSGPGFESVQGTVELINGACSPALHLIM